MFKVVVDNLKEFDQSVGELKKELEPLMKKPLHEVLADATPLQKAKFQLVMLYSLNSTVWAYLRLIGKDPKELPVKGELDRVRDYMKRAKEVEDQMNIGEPSLRVNKDAAKRVIKQAMWQAAHAKKKTGESSKNEEAKQSGKVPPDAVKSRSEPEVTSQKRKSFYKVDEFIEADDAEAAVDKKRQKND